jgi:hypothetical protein
MENRVEQNNNPVKGRYKMETTNEILDENYIRNNLKGIKWITDSLNLNWGQKMVMDIYLNDIHEYITKED